MKILADVTSLIAVALNLMRESERVRGGKTPIALHDILNSRPIPDLQSKSNLYS